MSSSDEKHPRERGRKLKLVVNNDDRQVFVIMRPWPEQHPHRIMMCMMRDIDEPYERFPLETHETDIIEGWYVSREFFYEILYHLRDHVEHVEGDTYETTNPSELARIVWRAYPILQSVWG